MHLAQLGHILVCIITRTTKLNLACFWTCCATNERSLDVDGVVSAMSAIALIENINKSRSIGH